jgi:hypothetical protein
MQNARGTLLLTDDSRVIMDEKLIRSMFRAVDSYWACVQKPAATIFSADCI